MFIDEIKSHKYRGLKTLSLYVCYACLGMCISLRGPALLDLAIATNTTLDQVAYSIPATSAGFIMGAIVCGFLMEYVDSQLLVGFTILGNSIAWAVIPWNRTLLSLCINMLIAGFFGGSTNTSSNVWLLHLWGKSTQPFMQAHHFFFGVGSMIGPLIVAPYLLPVSPTNAQNLTSLNQTSDQLANDFTADDLRIQLPYAFCGVSTFIAGLLFFTVYAFKRDNKPHPTRKVKDKESEDKGLPFHKKAIVVGLMGAMMFLYFGTEISIGSLLATYAVKCDLKVDKVTASYLTSLFWTSFTFFRCLTVFVVEFVGSTNLIIFDLLIILTANAFLFPFGHQYEWALWASSALIGIGMSSMFAALIGFLDECILVTNRITSFVMICGSLGVSLLPYLVGIYIDSYPESYSILCLTSAIGCTLIFALLVIIKKAFLSSKEITKL